MGIPISDVAFHQRLGRLVALAGQPGFWPAMAGLLKEAIRFDTWVVMLFRDGKAPVVLADQGANLSEQDHFGGYAEGLYLLDPFYTFSLLVPTTGLYRLDEVAPAHFRETEYFRRYFSLNVVEDELQFLIGLQEGGVLSLSLGSQSRFTDTEVSIGCVVQPWVTGLMQAAFRLEHSSLENLVDTTTIESGETLKARLSAMGSPLLTEREQEVALLMLAGHPAKGIARLLDISIDTVKAHRRNLYAKLGVNSQAGLFVLMMPSATQQPLSTVSTV